MSKSDKETFVMFKEHYNVIRDNLNDQQKGNLLDCIFCYQCGIDLPEIDDKTSIVWGFIKIAMDKTEKKYEEICERNRINGKKGGAPKGNNNASLKTTGRLSKQPKTTQNNPKQPKTTENNHYDKDYDYDKDNVNDNDDEKEIKEKSPSDCSTEQQDPENTSTVIPTVEQPQAENPPSSSSPSSSFDTSPKDPYTVQSKERKVALKERKVEEPMHIPSYVRKAYNRETEEQYTDSLLNDEKFLADTAITTNVPLYKIKEYVPIFIAHCRATEASHRSSGDFKSHFINYINKKEHNGKDTKHNFSTDAEQRRGFDNLKSIDTTIYTDTGL